MTQVFVVTQPSTNTLVVCSSEQLAKDYINQHVRSLCQRYVDAKEQVLVAGTPLVKARIIKLPLEEMGAAWNTFFENVDTSQRIGYQKLTVDQHIFSPSPLNPFRAKTISKKVDDVQSARQHLFHIVVKGLASQKWQRSVDADGYCVWSQPNDPRRCPAGWVIPLEEHSSPDAPSDNVGVVQQCGALKSFLSTQPGSVHEELGEFMRQMQYAHDDYPNPDGMHRRFVGLCVEYKLEAPPGLEEAPE